jgi:hypothetical protein
VRGEDRRDRVGSLFLREGVEVVREEVERAAHPVTDPERNGQRAANARLGEARGAYAGDG